MSQDFSTMKAWLEAWPILEEYLLGQGFGLDDERRLLTPAAYFASFPEEFYEDLASSPDLAYEDACAYLEAMASFLGLQKQIHCLSILPGTDKSGNPEGFEQIDLRPGEIVALVGPTGAGKSRLLQDIEWLADGDTPTGRRILVNGEKPDPSQRYSAQNKLVAELSQNMNFVMDLSVREFLDLHAESRMVADAEQKVQDIIRLAVELAGEKFTEQTNITALSGGQSRSLMIADTALLSPSPIVLIDELENAGVDKRDSLNILIKGEKIVLMATHDPVLALMADRRLVIQNGGIARVHHTSEEEKAWLEDLLKQDQRMLELRQALRSGRLLKRSDFE